MWSNIDHQLTRRRRVLRPFAAAILGIALSAPLAATIDPTAGAVALAATPVTVTMVATPSPSDFPDTVSVAYTLSPIPDTGTVTVQDADGTPSTTPQAIDGTGAGTIPWVPAAFGVHHLKVCFTGSVAFADSCSTTATQQVYPNQSTATLIATPASLYADEVLTLQVHLSPSPVNDVNTRICIDGSPFWVIGIDPATGDGELSLVPEIDGVPLAPGVHQLTQCYPGNRYTTPSTSAAVPVTIKMDASTTTLTATPSSVNPGESVTYNATVAPAPPDETVVGLSVHDGSRTEVFEIVLNAAGTGSYVLNTTGWPGGTAVATASFAGTRRLAPSQDAENITIANTLPTLAPSSASVTAGNGQTAAMTGTYADVDGNTVTLTADYGTVQKTTGTSSGTWSWHGAAGPTDRTVTITANDGFGNRTATFTVIVIPDSVAPTATGPKNSFVAGLTLSSRPPVKFAWTGHDATSGIDHYELALSTDGHAYVALNSSLATASYVRTLAAGHTYRARVRAIDHAGNVGAWAYGTGFRLTSYQESSRSIKYSGTWRTGSSAAFWGGKDRYATAAGARASLTFKGHSFAWLGSTGPSRGTAKVYVNGILVKTINLNASTTTNRKILFAATWSSAASRTVSIRISGTAHHPRGDVDALIVGS